MADAPLEAYLATQDAAVAPVVTALHAAIIEAHPAFDVAIKYRMLSYAIGADWKTWTCAIGTSTKVVSLRFLYGVILDDPLGVLRGGTSVLMNWDFPLDDPSAVDADAVGAYVREAADKYATYKADSDAIVAAARAAHGRPAPES